MIPDGRDDLDREIEAFYDTELLRAVLPASEPLAASSPPGGGLGIWLWTGSLWLLVLVVTVLTVLFR